MISEKCVRAVFSSGLEMSALSVRPAGLQAAALLDNRALRVRGVTTLESVRRNLFGCTDREENRRYVERDLARQLEIDSQRWGFDFAKEQPLPGAQRFAWQLVPASSIPAALRRSPVTVPQPSKPQEMKVSSPESSSKTQKRITDFLKPRKRLSTSVKKSPSNAHKHDLRPPKMPRLAQTHLKRTS